MARQAALSITTNGSAADQLAEIYGQVIDSVQKNALSARLKNQNYSGDPTGGSVEIDRFANATVKAYGTARAAGAGDKLKNSGKVTVNLDQDKEIVEEVEAKDIKLFGLPAIMAKRAANHDLRMIATLDNAFFAALEAAGSELVVDPTDPIADQVEALIQSIEGTQNDWVDGVERSMIVLTVKPSVYGKLKNFINTVNDRASEQESINMFNGVEILSNIRQTKDALAFIYGAAAQPAFTTGDYAEQTIPLSEAKASALFFHYGTKVVTPDLVKFATLIESESAGESE